MNALGRQLIVISSALGSAIIIVAMTAEERRWIAEVVLLTATALFLLLFMWLSALGQNIIRLYETAVKKP
jgi:hypothetical protein